tara:strand:- start:984 stop:1598 length:615 start_codon:yes stop_codon:yes gene_type:complete
MNLDKLKQAEANFLQYYPGGFADPELVAIGKKHNISRMTEISHDLLSKKAFANVGPVLDGLIKVTSRSSMVSMFEKPKYRDYVNSLNTDTRQQLALGYKALLHGNQEKGFNQILGILAEGKIAKWSLMTICPLYYRPEQEVFVKPTTAKRVIEALELENLIYKPRPSWEFYAEFRRQILDMKQKVHPSLAVNNAAFTGFLMMSL